MPLLFHTGLRRMFPLVRDAVARVLPSSGSGSSVLPLRGGRVRLAERVARGRAAGASRLRGIAAMTSINDVPTAAPRVLARRRDADLGGRPCGGSTRRTCRTRGSAGCSTRKRTRHPALQRPLHPGRPRPPAARGGRHPRAERGHASPDRLLALDGLAARSSSASPRSRRSPWPACTAAHCAATAPACCGPWEHPRAGAEGRGLSPLAPGDARGAAIGGGRRPGGWECHRAGQSGGGPDASGRRTWAASTSACRLRPRRSP